MRSFVQCHGHTRKGLTNFEFFLHASRKPQRSDLPHQVHLVGKCFVFPVVVTDRIVAQMNAAGGCLETTSKVLPNRLGHKRHKGRYQFRSRHQTLEQSPIGISFFRAIVIFAPKSLATAADVPVTQHIHKPSNALTGTVVVVGVHPLGDRFYRDCQLAQDPAIQFRAFSDRAIRSGLSQHLRIQIANVARQQLLRKEFVVRHRILDEESIDVPQSQNKLWDTFLDLTFTVLDRGPWRLLGKEIPTQRVRTIHVKDLLR